MEHVVGAKETERKGLDIAFFLDSEMNIPQTLEEGVNFKCSMVSRLDACLSRKSAKKRSNRGYQSSRTPCDRLDWEKAKQQERIMPVKESFMPTYPFRTPSIHSSSQLIAA